MAAEEDKQHQQGGEYSARRKYAYSSDHSYQDSMEEDGDDSDNEESSLDRKGHQEVAEAEVEAEAEASSTAASSLLSKGYGGISSPGSLGSGVIEDDSSTFSFSPFNSLFTSASATVVGEKEGSSSRRPSSASSQSEHVCCCHVRSRVGCTATICFARTIYLFLPRLHYAVCHVLCRFTQQQDVCKARRLRG
jgi:hypothetical protein